MIRITVKSTVTQYTVCGSTRDARSMPIRSPPAAGLDTVFTIHSLSHTVLHSHGSNIKDKSYLTWTRSPKVAVRRFGVTRREGGVLLTDSCDHHGTWGMHIACTIAASSTNTARREVGDRYAVSCLDRCWLDVCDADRGGKGEGSYGATQPHRLPPWPPPCVVR